MPRACWLLLGVLLLGPASALQLGLGLRGRHAVQSPRAGAGVRVARVVMAEEGGGGDGEGGAREKEKSRGRTAVISRPKPKPKQDRKEAVDHDKSWRVLLHNDDVHTFDYVTMAVRRPLLSARPPPALVCTLRLELASFSARRLLPSPSSRSRPVPGRSSRWSRPSRARRRIGSRCRRTRWARRR